jgi:glycosyltransferase involved in cell wall biosynthesis
MRRRKTFPFDIIDTHFGYPDGISGAILSWALGVPFTMTLRGNEPMHCHSWMVRLLMKFAVRRASRVFAVSERLRQFAITLGAAPGTVKTIPNGVDNTLFYLRDRMLCRRKHGFATDRPLIVSAGALIERKGHHRVLHAVKRLIDREIPVQLAIVGGAGSEGSYEPNIRKAVLELGLESSVRFMGVQAPDQMSELLSAADVLCLASTREGWPNVVHEALACGTPVVATDVGAIPDMIRDPNCGFVVPVNDKAALAAALERALRQEWDHKTISGKLSRSWRQVALEIVEEMRIVAMREESCK